MQTIVEFTRLGLNYKEMKNRKKKNPYTSEISAAEKIEIRKQIRALLELLYRKANAKKVEKLSNRITLIDRGDVEAQLIYDQFRIRSI